MHQNMELLMKVPNLDIALINVTLNYFSCISTHSVSEYKTWF